MITIIPTLEIIKAVTDTNITGTGANERREAFDCAVDLKSLGDVHILIEGILYDRLEKRLTEDHKIFFQSVCRIDNSAKGIVNYNIQKAINWVADSESKARKVIILTNNTSFYSTPNENIKIITPADFLYGARRILEFTKNKTFISIEEFILATFFFG